MQTKEELLAEQKQHREQMKANREKTMERKQRAHRLIVRGAIAEKLVPGADHMTNEQFQKALYDRLGQAGQNPR